MKQLFKISFVLLTAFLLNGNSFLYAHTNKANEIVFSEEISISLNDTNQEFEEIAEFDNQFRIPTLQSASFPTNKKKSKRPKFPFFEKEEKEKEDKSVSFVEFSKNVFSFSAILEIPHFAQFYNYNRNYLHLSENLNYFLFYKCYIPFQVFRL